MSALASTGVPASGKTDTATTTGTAGPETGTAATGFAADAALAHRDLLLDAGWVAARLSERLAADGSALEVLDCRLVRAKYRIGESVRATYALDTPAGTVRASARMFAGDDSGDGGAALVAHGKARRAAVPVPGLQPVLHDAPYRTVWWVLPNDRRLRNVGAFLHPGATPPLPLAGWQRSHIAEYAAERSLTVRAEDAAGAPVGFVKLFAPGSVDVEVLAHRYRTLSTALPCPRVLHAGTDVLVQQPLAGCTLADIDQRELPGALQELGAVIARLHRHPLAATTAPFRRLDTERVAHSAELVGRARPDVADLARRIAELVRRGPRPSGGRVLLHGDCHPKNALVAFGRLSLIDLDQAGSGPAAADLASLLARLDHDVLAGRQDRARAELLAGAFLDGYRAERPLPDDASLRWYTAAALVAERAIRAVNRVDAEALAHLEALLAHAVTLLEHR